MTENSEICRINADGTTTYHWDNIETAAQRWQPGCDDISVYVSKLLLPLRPNLEWVGLTDEDVMVAAYQAGFDIHEDYDNDDDDPKEMHWWTPDGEVCDDSLLKLRDIIEAKLKEKNS